MKADFAARGWKIDRCEKYVMADASFANRDWNAREKGAGVAEPFETMRIAPPLVTRGM